MVNVGNNGDVSDVHNTNPYGYNFCLLTNNLLLMLSISLRGCKGTPINRGGEEDGKLYKNFLLDREGKRSHTKI
jgi:hypothetical protein